MIINLNATLKSWGTENFNAALIGEIMSLKPGVIPLQQALTQGDTAAELPDKVSVISSSETDTDIVVMLAIFFTEIISGCSCGDEPENLNGYCEMQLLVKKSSAEAEFRIAN